MINLNVKVYFSFKILKNLNFDLGTHPTQKILNLKNIDVFFIIFNIKVSFGFKIHKNKIFDMGTHSIQKILNLKNIDVSLL